MSAAALPPLDRRALSALAPEQRPPVDPAELRTRVVHFGLGAFHRAHQALYTQNAAARSGEPWGISAVAPRSTGTIRALRSQDCLYSLTERHPGGSVSRVVGALTGALGMRTDASAVHALLTDPEVTVVTLTITEKGYQRPDQAGGPDVIGCLAEGLAARIRRGAAPISVVSCDNMADNGAVLGRAVEERVRAAAGPDAEQVLALMADTVAFPATVVDRIVPATGEDDRAVAASALGFLDAVPVMGEPYRQWVLQDSFAAPRPPWERDGAMFVPDVAPYQLTKLRLLNGSHSALAYLGLAAGHTTIADTMAGDWGERLVRALCAEVAPTLPAGGPDPGAYADDLVVRFRNPAMRHLLRQIGSDGSLKLTERWLPALRSLRAKGTATPVLELALAAWVYATRADHGITDPALDALTACWTTTSRPAETVRALLCVLGAADLADDTALTAAVADRLPALEAGRIEV